MKHRPPREVPPHVPTPRLYVYFDAIIRQGSLRRAAGVLGIAPSALNRRMADLETEVGARLFERQRTGVRPTAAGGIFARHVERVLRDAEQTAAELRSLGGDTAGQVAVSAAESAAIDFLPPIFAALQARTPGLRFVLTVGTPAAILLDLLEDRADLILTHEAPVHRDVAVMVTVRRMFCALLRAGHPLAGKAVLRIDECNDFPCVLATENFAARALVDAMMARSAPRAPPVLITNAFEAMKRYVRTTDAVSFQFNLAEPVSDGLVAIPLADAPVADATLSLAVRRDRVLPPRLAAVCEHIAAQLRLTDTAGTAVSPPAASPIVPTHR